MSPREALWLATRGGARILGRTDCGSLEAGRRADFAVWDIGGIPSAGTWDKVAGLLLSPPAGARDVYVEGLPIVRGGELVTVGRERILQASEHSLKRLVSVS